MGLDTDAPRRWRLAVAGVAAGILVGGTVAVVAPAVATQDTSYAATNWKKIWKKNLRKYADKRYYTKAQSDAKYAAAGSSYSKAESDSKYAGTGSSYSKAESDAKYAGAQPLLRGSWALGDAPDGTYAFTSIDYGAVLAASPTTQLIRVGDPLPPGCSGTANAPNASPGYLCIFEKDRTGTLTLQICSTGSCVAGTGGPIGTLVYWLANAGSQWSYGSWALRPVALAPANSAEVAPSAGGPKTGAPGSPSAP